MPNVTNDQKAQAVSVKELYLKLKMSYLASGKSLTEIKKESSFKGNAKLKGKLDMARRPFSEYKTLQRTDMKAWKYERGILRFSV